MIKIFFISIFLLMTAYANDITAMNGYTKEPLEKPLFPYAYTITETMAVNNYLNANLNKLDKNNKQKIKEHIYNLMSSYISEYYKKNNKIMVDKDDLIMKSLFSSAQKLNSMGANLAYYQLFQMKNTDQLKNIGFTKDFKLSLKYDLFNIEHKFWSINFPYYFMIGRIGESKINNSNTTIVKISTAGAKDKSKFGYSQATITLFVSDKKDDKVFFEHWYNAFKIPSSIKLKSIGIKNYKSQRIYNKNYLLNTEITSWSTNTNSFIVVYSGIDGTFQQNRQHFLDFLKSIANKT
jgi:hypothetical protein